MARKYTIDDFDHYLYHDLGFDGGEVDDLIVSNQELITDMLARGKRPADIANAIDDSTVRNVD